MANELIQENIVIDLEENNRTVVPLSRSIYIEFPERDYSKVLGGSFIKRLAMRRTRKKVSVGIRNMKMSDKLVLREGTRLADLFTFIFNGEECDVSTLPKEFSLEKEKTSFQLYFSPESIEDCLEKQSRPASSDNTVYKVTGQIFVTNTDNEEIDTQDFEIDIKLKHIEPNVKMHVATIKGGRINFNELQSGYMPIGELQLTNPAFFKRMPAVNFKGNVSVVGNDGRKIDDIVNDNGETKPRIIFQTSDSSDISIKDVLSKKVMIDGKLEYEPVRVKILMNFQGVRNPMDTYLEYDININGAWFVDYNPDILHPLRDNRRFRLMKDTQETELRVNVNGKEALNGVRNNLEAFEFIPGGDFRKEVNVILNNIATDTSRGGVLRIMNPRISSVLCDANITLFDSRRKAFDINDIISLEGDAIELSLRGEDIIIPNGDKSSRSFKIMFDPHKLFKIDPNGTFRFSVNSLLEFDYYENSDGRDWKDVESKNFKVLLNWDFNMLPFPQWLCVDYGSSAIVCMYDGKLVDLSKRRKEIFALVKRNSSDDKWTIKPDSDESDTMFIPSDMLLNTINLNNIATSQLCSEREDTGDYDKLAICLSPTSQLIQSNFQRNLPCLKLLVGNRYLPENPDYNAFKYARRDDEGRVSVTTIAEAKDNEEPNSLSNISTLFDEAYKVLFRYYLSNEIPNMDRVNRLVLTYPNSYTPEHLRILENIAKSTFVNIRPGCLKFVSESDAVAAYYMDHWKEYNPNDNMELTENIIVYDMGAGTLDLTYLTKSYDRKNGCYSLEIKGKIGISKAGNYLDFVLAKIVDPKLAVTSRPKGANADRTAKARIALKEKVKGVLKPAISSLDPGTTINLDYESNQKDVSIYSVIDNPLFKQYLYDCTYGVFNQLEAYMGQKLVVDTVIFSGRSCRLKPLQEQLKNAVSGIMDSRPSGIRFIDLELPGTHDRQKTAVVKGAEKFAGSYSLPTSKVKIISKRLYASYGVAFKGLGGEWQYHELINHKEMPNSASNQSLSFNALQIHGMTHATEVILVQSYLSKENTLESLRNRDFEYISEMSRYNLDSFAGRDTLSMAIGIDTNNRVTLYVDGNPARGEAPKGIDLNNEITKQSIWPATI